MMHITLHGLDYLLALLLLAIKLFSSSSFVVNIETLALSFVVFLDALPNDILYSGNLLCSDVIRC
jgi:hypothetical protein